MAKGVLLMLVFQKKEDLDEDVAILWLNDHLSS